MRPEPGTEAVKRSGAISGGRQGGKVTGSHLGVLLWLFAKARTLMARFAAVNSTGPSCVAMRPHDTPPGPKFAAIVSLNRSRSQKQFSLVTRLS
jgi:hypothetical protein